ncbi:MAG: PEGA domain-containing protein [Deltaproteobacteria bacterium]
MSPALFVAVAAIAQTPQAIAILPTVVGDSDAAPTSRALFDATRDATAWRRGLVAVPYNTLFLEGAAPVARTLRECGARPDCIRRVMREHDIDLLLNVIASYAVDPPIVTLTLIDDGESTQNVVFQPAASSVTALLPNKAAQLLDTAGFDRVGGASIAVVPAGARIALEGADLERSDAGQSTFRATPGTYALSVTLDGHEPIRREVSIAEGETTRVELLLQPIAVEPAIVERHWFWVAVGAVVVGAATTAVVVATRPDAATCLCIGGPETVCPPCE